MASNAGFHIDLVSVESVKCPICMDRLREPRRAPDCGHYLCARCLDTLESSTTFEHVRSLQAYARVRTFVCPACGAQNRIAGETLDGRRSFRSSATRSRTQPDNFGTIGAAAVGSRTAFGGIGNGSAIGPRSVAPTGVGSRMGFGPGARIGTATVFGIGNDNAARAGPPESGNEIGIAGVFGGKIGPATTVGHESKPATRTNGTHPGPISTNGHGPASGTRPADGQRPAETAAARGPSPGPNTTDSVTKCRCSVHESRKENIMFCEDCSTFCCSEECVLLHPRHLLRSATLVTDSLRDEYIEADRRLAALSSQLAVVVNGAMQFGNTARGDADRLKEALANAAEELKAEIDEYGRRVNDRLDQAVSVMTATYDQSGPTSVAAVAGLSEAVSQSRFFVQRLLAEGDAISMLESRNTIVSTRQSLETGCNETLRIGSLHDRVPFISHVRGTLGLETVRTALHDSLAEQARRPVCFGTIRPLPSNAQTLITIDDLLSTVGNMQNGRPTDWTVHAVHAHASNLYVSVTVGKSHYVLESRCFAAASDSGVDELKMNMNAGSSFIRRRNTRIVCRLPQACVALLQHDRHLVLCLTNCTVVSYDLDSCTPTSVRLSPIAARNVARAAFVLFLRQSSMIAVCFQNASAMHLLKLTADARKLEEAECVLVPDVAAIAHDSATSVSCLISRNQLIFCDEKLKIVATFSGRIPENVTNGSTWLPVDVRCSELGLFFVVDSESVLHAFDSTGRYVAQVGVFNQSVWNVATIRGLQEHSETHVHAIYFDDADRNFKQAAIASGFSC